MRHPITPRLHGVLDYTTSAAIATVLPAMPWALGFAEHRAARNLCVGLTALTLVVAALTDWRAER